MGFLLKDENQAYAWLLSMHLHALTYRAKAMPESQWDWTPDPATPTARTLVVHAWHWLVCDRYHIEIPDVDAHPPVPEPPREPAAIVAALEEETQRWVALIEGFTPEDFERPIRQFGQGEPGNVRGFVGHMIQNAIYKSGQLSMLFFTLHHDGTEPYDCPWPNAIYKEVREEREMASS